MPDNTFHHPTTDIVEVNKETHVPATNELPQSQNLEQQHQDPTYVEAKRLRGRVNLLSGLLLAFVILTCGLTALILNLLAQQRQQAKQISSLTATNQADAASLKALGDRTTLLSQQITSLNRQVPKDLPNQLKLNQKQMKDLETRISEVKLNSDTLRQVNEILLRQMPSKNSKPTRFR